MSGPLFKLVFPSGDLSPRLLEVGTYRIGAADDADLRLAGEGVAAEHCTLQVGAHGVQMRVAPGCSVSVNERPVDGVIALRTDDVVAIGRSRLRLLDQAAAPAAGARATTEGGTREVLSTMVRPVLPRFVLKGLSGDMLGRSVPLHAAISVGRAGECDLRLALDGVSRVHARLTPADTSVLVEDMGSANGTWLNGRRVLREQAVHGDEIRFDAQRFQLLLPGQPLPSAGARAGTVAHRGGRSAWVAGLALLVLLALTAYILLR